MTRAALGRAEINHRRAMTHAIERASLGTGARARATRETRRTVSEARGPVPRRRNASRINENARPPVARAKPMMRHTCPYHLISVTIKLVNLVKLRLGNARERRVDFSLVERQRRRRRRRTTTRVMLESRHSSIEDSVFSGFL